MTSIWVPPLLEISGSVVETWNRLLSFSGQAIPLPDSGAELRFSSAAPPSSDALVAEIKLRGSASGLFVTFASFPFKQLCGAELGVEDLAILPSALCEAIHKGMLAHVASLLSSEKLLHWHLVRVGRETEVPTADIQWFEAVISQAGADMRLRVGARIGDWLRLANSPPDQVAGPMREALCQGISAPVYFTIGTITVTHRELATLKPGTIVVMARREPDTAQVCVETTLCNFVRTEEGWCCTGLDRLSRGATVPIRDVGDMADDNSGASYGTISHGLRIALVFEIGRRTVPLSELSTWRDGALIELDPPAAEAGMEVTIRANGDAIGTGDLVMIDDRIAVRITRLIL